MHNVDGRWVDITTTVQSNVICGVTQSFSQFAVGYGFPYTLRNSLEVTKVTFTNNKGWQLTGYLNLEQTPDILASIDTDGFVWAVADAEGIISDAFAIATFQGKDCRSKSGHTGLVCRQKGLGTTTFTRAKRSEMYKVTARIRVKHSLVLPKASQTPLQVKLTVPASTTAFLDEEAGHCKTRRKGRLLSCQE
jgi:hypothetical protein